MCKLEKRCIRQSRKMATSAEKAAQRNVIEYRAQLKMSPTQSFKQLQTTEKYKNVSRALEFKSHKRFAGGCTGKSDSKLGRPTRSLITLETSSTLIED